MDDDQLDNNVFFSIIAQVQMTNAWMPHDSVVTERKVGDISDSQHWPRKNRQAFDDISKLNRSVLTFLRIELAPPHPPPPHPRDGLQLDRVSITTGGGVGLDIWVSSEWGWGGGDQWHMVWQALVCLTGSLTSRFEVLSEAILGSFFFLFNLLYVWL